MGEQVHPTIQRFRTDNEIFTEDIRRDMQELKVLVGCLEACIPKETRNAVNLFKRAVAVVDEQPHSPRHLQLEGQILALREDMEARMTGAEDSCGDQCGKVTEIVRSMERKQELWESKLHD